MIKSFADKHTKALAEGKRVARFESFQARAQRKLQMLDSAPSLAFLAAVPGNQLEALKRERVGQHSIRINDQWRVCFVWHDGHAHAVEITDYH